MVLGVIHVGFSMLKAGLGVIVISISCKGVKEENPKTAIQKAENQLSFLLQDAEKANPLEYAKKAREYIRSVAGV